jgi:hypothetical protein
MVHAKDFVNLNGIKGQLEHNEVNAIENLNENVGFKCLHYSVTESNGKVELTILKHSQIGDVHFGVKTIDSSAKEGHDYEKFSKQITMKQGETEKKIEINIIDNNEWEPDMDFAVELYDYDSEKRLDGDDTRAIVTILDEDFPGTLGFKVTDIRVKKDMEKVDIVIIRTNGSDGDITCMISTEALQSNTSGAENGHNAIEFEDYIPITEKITFENGETEKIVSIKLLDEHEKMAEIDGVKKPDDDDKSNDEEA